MLPEVCGHREDKWLKLKVASECQWQGAEVTLTVVWLLLWDGLSWQTADLLGFSILTQPSLGSTENSLKGENIHWVAAVWRKMPCLCQESDRLVTYTGVNFWVCQFWLFVHFLFNFHMFLQYCNLTHSRPQKTGFHRPLLQQRKKSNWPCAGKVNVKACQANWQM